MAEQLPPVSLVCPQCSVQFKKLAWRVRKAKNLGHKIFCSKKCFRLASKAKRTPEMLAEYHAEYRRKNRLILRKKNKKWRQENHDKAIKLGRKYYYARLEKNRKIAREYARLHPEQASARQKKWYEENRDRVTLYSVRSRFAKKFGIPPKDVPDDIVDAQVEYINLIRWIKDAKADQSPKGGDSEAAPFTRAAVSNADLPNPTPKEPTP